MLDTKKAAHMLSDKIWGWGELLRTIFGKFYLCNRDLPSGSDSKASAYNAGDHSSIPGFGRSPGEGNGNPLQYPCLENSMDGGAWYTTVHGVTDHVFWENFQYNSFGRWVMEESGGGDALQVSSWSMTPWNYLQELRKTTYWVWFLKSQDLGHIKVISSAFDTYSDKSSSKFLYLF